MRTRIVALVMLLSMLLGVFGCTTGYEETDALLIDCEPQFIGGGKSDALSDSRAVERPENLMDFGMTSDNPKASAFQIVYPVSISQTLVDEAWELAEDIIDVTGRSVNVVQHLSREREYEIVLQTGSTVARAELLATVEEFEPLMGDRDFLLKTVGNRLLVYGKTEQAIILALHFLRAEFAYRNKETREYGVDAELEYMHKPTDHPPVKVETADDPCYFEFSLENTALSRTYARLSFTSNHGWRLQTKAGEHDEYNDMGAAQRLAHSLGEPDPSVLEEIEVAGAADGIYRLNAPDGSYATVNTNEASFRLDFYTASGRLAASVNNILSNVGGSIITGELEEDEAIFGTGERFNTANQRGNRIDMFTQDIWSRADACYMVIPLLCSSRGSGIFVNLYEQMTVDLGNENADEWQCVVPEVVSLDVYFFTTEKISEVIQGYSELTGYADMPEEWTYGMIVCAYAPDLSKKWTAQITPSEDGRGEGVYEMIAHMEQYDLPWTGVLVEAWDTYFVAGHEDLKELCDYVHSLGKKFEVYIMLGMIGDNMKVNSAVSDRTMSFLNTDYYLKQRLSDGTVGYFVLTSHPSSLNHDSAQARAYLDITNPDAVDWYFNKYFSYLANDVGVDGVKIDFCEQISEKSQLLYYDASVPTAGAHHWYPAVFCELMWDVISSKPDGGMLYTRGGGIGMQRAPYMWAGDQTRSYDGLKFQLTAVLSSGLSGVPYMSYDMSGYQYGIYSASLEYESQVFLRGLQFTVYTICMQTHGMVRRSYQFAEEDANYAYVTEIYRAYTKLHEHLTPYITELSEQASTTGMPVMRHLILGWQNDKNVYNIEDEYTFGDAFLIAPILDDGYVRDIYLPEGEWIDLNTGKEYSVGAEGLWLEDYEATIAELPTFYNKNTASELAPTLVDGIMELYDYARSVAP